MHEVSLAEGIVDVALRAAKNAGAEAVSEVKVAVGELSTVEVDALRFAFESVKKGTAASAANLVIERVPGKAWCYGCGKNVPLHRFGDACPECGGYRLTPVEGREMKVVDLKAVFADKA